MEQRGISGNWYFWVFVAIYPGFFFYQTAIGVDAIKPILGGYFGLASAAAFAVCLAAIIRNTLRTRPTVHLIDLLVFFLLALIILVAIIHLLTGGKPDVPYWHFGLVYQALLAYILFSLMRMGAKEKIVIRLILFMMFACALLFSDGLAMDFRSAHQGSTHYASYQGFALPVLLTLLLCVVGSEKIIARAAMYAAGISSLHWIGARSETLLAVMFFMTFELLLAKNKSLLLSIAIPAAFIVGAYIIFAGIDGRISTVANLSSDESFTIRSEITETALTHIMDSPIIGAYAYYDMGYYPHNLLAIWVDLGLAGLFLFFALLIACTLTLVAASFGKAPDGLQLRAAAAALLLSSALMVVAAKHYTYVPFVAAVAMTARASRGSPATGSNHVNVLSVGYPKRSEASTGRVGGAHKNLL